MLSVGYLWIYINGKKRRKHEIRSITAETKEKLKQKQPHNTNVFLPSRYHDSDVKSSQFHWRPPLHFHFHRTRGTRSRRMAPLHVPLEWGYISIPNAQQITLLPDGARAPPACSAHAGTEWRALSSSHVSLPGWHMLRNMDQLIAYTPWAPTDTRMGVSTQHTPYLVSSKYCPRFSADLWIR